MKANTETTGQKQSGRFVKGQSGNPNGRPKGPRNTPTVAVETLLDGQTQALTQKAIDLALAGDITALRLCLDRILPVRKDRPVMIRGDELRALRRLGREQEPKIPFVFTSERGSPFTTAGFARCFG